MGNISELEDLLLSMRNNIDISLLLIAMGKDKLLPTVLEALFQQAQEMVDYCIVDDA